MARTKKSEAKVKVEEVVAPLEMENVTPEPVKIEEAIAEPIKPVKQRIIANKVTPLYRVPNLATRYMIGHMPIGVAFEIEKEHYSDIYGWFYLLSNGAYITKAGNYTIN